MRLPPCCLPLQDVVHADIKPENIMFSGPSSSSVLKLIDFGLSSFVGCGAEPGGTPEFLAPEILQVGGRGGCSRGLICVTEMRLGCGTQTALPRSLYV